MISPEGEEEPTTATYLDYTTYKRKSKVFVSLSLPAPVTLLLSASESYRVCKLTVEKPRNPEGGGPSKNGGGSSSSAKSCMLETTVTLSGPLKVYGNHTARVNVDQLLNEKQEFTFTVKTDSAVADTTIESRFNIKSVLFEDSILEFAKIFNVPIVSAGENVEPLSGGSSKFFSRQTMMVGIARLLRSINESVLNMGIEGEGVSQ